VPYRSARRIEVRHVCQGLPTPGLQQRSMDSILEMAWATIGPDFGWAAEVDRVGR